MSASASPPPLTSPADRWLDAAALVLVACFLLEVVYFAFRIAPLIFPDEVTHYGLSRLFAETWLPPRDSPDSYRFGLVTHVPVLYYVLMGKLLALNLLPIPDLLFLRLANGLLGLATILLALKWARLLVRDRLVTLVFLLMLTNTLMFTFLCAAVSYDNLVNLLAMASLYLLFAYFESRRPTLALAFVASVGAGALTKLSFLPFGVLLLLVFLHRERRSLGDLARAIIADLTAREWRTALLAATCAAVVVANVALYGENLVRFGRLAPRADQVLKLENALESRVFARDYIVDSFRNGEIGLSEAVAMLPIIRHEGDRRGALFLLRQAAIERSRGASRLDRLGYVPVWAQRMSAKTLGIMAHKSMEKQHRELLPYYILLLLAGARLPWAMRRAGARWIGSLVFVTFGYAIILMQLVNYPAYDRTGVVDAALQGRYVFPVLAPLYLLLADSLVGGLSRRWQWGIGLVVGSVFVAGELPFFLARVTSEWLGPP